jgi:threonine dehydratase
MSKLSIGPTLRDREVDVMDRLSNGDNSTAAIPLAELHAARARISPFVYRTPLVRLETDGDAEIYLKLENLQPIGSFKLRGAGNAIASAPAQRVAGGVWTASAGNMAQGVAWHARRLGVPCEVVVPDHAPEAKRAAVERLGGRIIGLPFVDWWHVLVTGWMAGRTGLFVHPVCDHAVMAGNGTIGLEILEDLPDVDTIVVPFGGGGLICGIASAVRHLRPEARVLAAEVDTSAALAAALAAGEPVDIDYRPSFVDGIGSSRVLDAMWAAVRNLVDGSVVSSLAQVGAGLRVLAERNNVVAEGAAAAAVAAALSGRAGPGKIVCVVSGGNIDLSRLAQIFSDPDVGAPQTGRTGAGRRAATDLHFGEE